MLNELGTATLIYFTKYNSEASASVYWPLKMEGDAKSSVIGGFYNMQQGLQHFAL